MRSSVWSQSLQCTACGLNMLGCATELNRSVIRRGMSVNQSQPSFRKEIKEQIKSLHLQDNLGTKQTYLNREGADTLLRCLPYALIRNDNLSVCSTCGPSARFLELKAPDVSTSPGHVPDAANSGTENCEQTYPRDVFHNWAIPQIYKNKFGAYEARHVVAVARRHWPNVWANRHAVVDSVSCGVVVPCAAMPSMLAVSGAAACVSPATHT